MPKVELELTQETLEQVRRSAEADQVPAEQWLARLVERATAPDEDRILGLFSDAPELMDGVVEDAMRSRETHALRDGSQ